MISTFFDYQWLKSQYAFKFQLNFVGLKINVEHFRFHGEEILNRLLHHGW